MEVEQERGEQYDPVEVANAEQQDHIELGSNPSTHPLNRGGWRVPTAGEIAATTDPDRPIDWSVFRTVSGMDAGGE